MIACIWTNMGPYHWARARAAAALAVPCAFIEISSQQGAYPWDKLAPQPEVDHHLLFDRPLEELPASAITSAVLSTLNRLGPQIVFTTRYDLPFMRGAARWAKKHGGAAVLCSDSWAGDHRRWWLLELAKRVVVPRLYDAAFVAGQRSAEYALSLGISPHRIWYGLDVVDNDFFASGADQAQSQGGLREQLHLPADYFICVARFLWEKNLPTLLEAFSRYRRGGGRWQLVLVGDGPTKAEVQRRAEQSDLAGAVHLWPWASYEELPALYAFAKCLVLPSVSETWGLVVNEAMAAGLPVLVSNQCGCVPELCRMGVNGFVFDPWDVDGLAELMTRMSDGSTDLAAMGQASREIISTWTPEAWARSLLDCTKRVGAAAPS
jgi:1,2-diacylglycerol 3-alpha-glucosyltransferase